MAVAMENFTLTVVDIDTREVVRQLSGHAGVITDLTFSSDCRWLVSVSMDGTGKVWDLPTVRVKFSVAMENFTLTVGRSQTLPVPSILTDTNHLQSEEKVRS